MTNPKKNSHALQQIGDRDRKLVGESQENETCGDTASAADVAHPLTVSGGNDEGKGPFSVHLTDARTCPSRDLPPRITWRRAQDICGCPLGSTRTSGCGRRNPVRRGREKTIQEGADGLPGRRSGSVARVGRFARCRVDVGTRRGQWQVRQPRGGQPVGEVQGRGLDCWG